LTPSSSDVKGAWNVTEPGVYVESGTGNLYLFPLEAFSSPVVRLYTQDGSVLVLLSRDPFITTFEARILAAEHDIKLS